MRGPMSPDLRDSGPALRFSEALNRLSVNRLSYPQATNVIYWLFEPGRYNGREVLS